MVRLSQFLAASAVILGASASAVLDLIPTNFDNVVLKSGKPALVEFFAPWCGHCKTLAPIYEELATSFEFAKDKVAIAKVDADAEKDLGRRFGVQGFPTLKWFDGKSDTPEDYKGGRDIESLSAFITEKTGIKPKGKKAVASSVEMLSTKSFKEKIGGEQEAIVAFTAPWCGHCKTLAPTWEQLATDFAAETGVLIAKVDCEAAEAKDIAKEMGVASYPTIKYFAKGDKNGVDYSGGRTEEALVQFMNEKAGTFRSVGGTLNKLAGLVPSLDELVDTLKTGGEEAYTAFETAATAVKDTATDKYYEYYGKVAKKSHQNTNYASKELARLTSLLKKGGLVPEKADEMTWKSNILNKFIGSDGSVKDEL